MAYPKPSFIFGDTTRDEGHTITEGDKWIYLLDMAKHYLQPRERHLPLSYFMPITERRLMNWHLTPETDSVYVGVLNAHGFSRAGPRQVMGLTPGLVGKDAPVDKDSLPAPTFLTKFTKDEGNFPPSDFRAPGWVCPTHSQWSKLTNFILDSFPAELRKIRLYDAVRTTCYGLETGVANFFGVLELYCPASGTFFTPVGNMGLALHEMWDVSRLSMGNIPYEEYPQYNHELLHLSSAQPGLYEVYREIMCHFQICLDLHPLRSGVVGLKGWTDYLFTNQKGTRRAVRVLAPTPSTEIQKRMLPYGRGDVTLKDEDVYNKGDIYKSYHRHAMYPLSAPAILAGYLALWLKRCVVPSHPRDGISPMAMFPAVQLVFERALELLPAMVCEIRKGLQSLVEAMSRKEKFM